MSSKTELGDLEKRIEQFKQKQAAKKQPSAAAKFAENAMRVAAEFIAPVFIGISIGYLLDKCFDTRIIFMLILANFGLAAGMLNVYRAAKQIERDIDRSK